MFWWCKGRTIGIPAVYFSTNTFHSPTQQCSTSSVFDILFQQTIESRTMNEQFLSTDILFYIPDDGKQDKNPTQSFRPPSLQCSYISAVWPTLLWFSWIHRMMLVYICVLFHYWSYIAVFFWDSVVLLSWCWDSNNQSLDGVHLLETDIPYSTLVSVLPALVKCHINSKSFKIRKLQPVASLMVWASVSNNELFCQRHLLFGHVELLCFSWVFRSLCNKCRDWLLSKLCCDNSLYAPDVKSEASEGKTENLAVISVNQIHLDFKLNH